MNAWISQPGPSCRISFKQSRCSDFKSGTILHRQFTNIWRSIAIPLFRDQPLDVKILSQRNPFLLKSHYELNCSLSVHFVTKYEQNLLANIYWKSIAEYQPWIRFVSYRTWQYTRWIWKLSILLPLALSLKTKNQQKKFSVWRLGCGTAEIKSLTVSRQDSWKISGEFARATFEELGWDEKDGESDDDRG